MKEKMDHLSSTWRYISKARPIRERETHLDPDQHFRLDEIGDVTILINTSSLEPQPCAILAPARDDGNIHRRAGRSEVIIDRVGLSGLYLGTRERRLSGICGRKGRRRDVEPG